MTQSKLRTANTEGQARKQSGNPVRKRLLRIKSATGQRRIEEQATFVGG